MPAGDGSMWLDEPFRRSLNRAGLDGLRAVMSTMGGRCLRVLRDRENWRLELPDRDRTNRGLFLKRHHVRSWSSRLRARLGMGPGETAGRAEARNARRLAAAGIDVMHLVAYGEHLRADGTLESFVLTDELRQHIPLDRFFTQRFAPRDLHHVRPREAHFDDLLRRVAEVARRFHQAGYNHRDLYCCHFFIHEPEPGRFDVRLIDLQRVEHRRRRRWRWIVKDLAQLAYSAPRDRVSCTQKLAFMRHYLGVAKLRPRDKRLIRAVLAKQQLMEQRQGIIA